MEGGPESKQVGEGTYFIFKTMPEYNLTGTQVNQLFYKFERPELEPGEDLISQRNKWDAKLKDVLAKIDEENNVMEQKFFADVCIYYLYFDILGAPGKYPNVQRIELPESLVNWLIQHVTALLETEKPLVEVKTPCKIFGDLHGQYEDFMDILMRQNLKVHWL